MDREPASEELQVDIDNSGTAGMKGHGPSNVHQAQEHQHSSE